MTASSECAGSGCMVEGRGVQPYQVGVSLKGAVTSSPPPGD